MTVNSFLQTLELPDNSSPDAVERRFSTLLKSRIQAVSESYDEKTVEREVAALRQFHAQFFQYVSQWAAIRIRSHGNKTDIPEAARLKDSARALVADLQKNIVEFAICYMRINRFVTLLRDEIRRERVKDGTGPMANIKADADTGEMIRRQNKEKKRLISANQRLKDARDVLEDVDQRLSAVRGDFLTLSGSRDKEDPALRSLTAALRTANFTRARQVVGEMAGARKKFGTDPKTAASLQERLKQQGTILIDILTANAKTLEGPDGKLFLRVSETGRVYNAQIRELAKIKAFMNKYHFPYMDYKIDSLMHLKDKLMVTGSLDNLLGLYLKLMTMIAEPLIDMKELRRLENDVYLPVRYLVETHFPEVPRILARADETVREFRADRLEQQELEKIELEEIQEEDSI